MSGHPRSHSELVRASGCSLSSVPMGLSLRALLPGGHTASAACLTERLMGHLAHLQTNGADQAGGPAAAVVRGGKATSVSLLWAPQWGVSVGI